MTQREFFSKEAEDGVIGALMRNPDLCEEIGATLAVDDFYHSDLGALYGMVLSCHSNGVKPDPVSLGDISGTLPSGEGTIYTAGMIAMNVVSAANARHYAKIVSERAIARRMYMVGQQILELAASHGQIPAQIAEAQQLLLDLSVPEGTPDVVAYSDVLGGAMERIEQRRENRGPSGIRFQLVDLDQIVKGLRPGNLVIIAGKPGTGKTVLATGLADKIAMEEHKASLIFSLEMTKEELIDRSLAAAAEVSKETIDDGSVMDDFDANQRLFEAHNRLHAADVRICDKPALTFGRLCNIARFQHRVRPLDLIVIDYLTLIRSDAGSKHGTRSAEIGSFTRGLKALGKELGVPVVVLAQLNRAMDGRQDGRPRLSDLRDSGEIEQDADVVILGYRDESQGPGKSGITEWDVAKVRHAKPARCTLQFLGHFQKFVNAAKSDAYAYERLAEKTGRASKPRLDDMAPGGF